MLALPKSNGIKPFAGRERKRELPFVLGWQRRANWPSLPRMEQDRCDAQVAGTIPWEERALGLRFCVFEEARCLAGWHAGLD